jgi:hypothetical protein
MRRGICRKHSGRGSASGRTRPVIFSHFLLLRDCREPMGQRAGELATRTIGARCFGRSDAQTRVKKS